MKTYHIITLGCQMNQSDSERISSYLDNLGYRKNNSEKADIIVITTCGVRQSAEDRAYSLVHKIKKQNPSNKIILTGCLSRRKDVQARLKKKVDIWLNITDLPNLADLLEKEKNKISSLKNYLLLKPKHSSSFSAFVPIGNGCDNFCSYCVVPYARGRETYRIAENIIKEIEDLIKKKYKEITLIAQNVNSYQCNQNNQSKSAVNFPKLLKKINSIPGKFWLRFLSSHPKDLSDELIKAMAECEKLCEYLHLPVQSGNNEILAKMNRKYTREYYLKLIKKIRKTIPGISITTDIIVGFPGETEEQFQETLDLAREAKFNMIYIGQYSPRPNTAAWNLEDNISRAEKRDREYRLMQIIRENSLALNQGRLEQELEILVEGKNRQGQWYGKTRTFENIKIKNSPKEDLEGRFVKLKVNYVRDLGMEGELI